MPEPKIRLNLSTLGQLQQPPNPGIGWVGPERPAESWADIAADPLSALFDIGRGAVTGDAPPGMNLQGLGSILGAALPVAQGAKSLRALTKAAAIEDVAQQGIKAYHGSPHDFDKFSLSKIGTGEGAQAYGHGLYFAENEGTARQYKTKLAGAPDVLVGGEPVSTSKLIFDPKTSGEIVAKRIALRRQAYDQLGHPDTPHVLAKVLDEVEGDIDAALELAVHSKDEKLRQSLAKQKATLGDMREQGVTAPVKGKMYEVQIHASPDQFLDWDKPLSEQPEKIRQAIDAIGAKRTIPGPVEIRQNVYGDKKFYHVNRASGEWGSQAFDTKEAAQAAAPADAIVQDVATSTSKGGEFYSRAGHLLGGPDVLSDKLKQAGIPGIRYLDAGSRAGGEGTRNFVIFDENLVSILKKYGVALPVIEGLRERAKQNGGVISRKDVDGLEQ